MVRFRQTNAITVFLLFICGAIFSPAAHATQDVEEPSEIIRLMRLLLSEPLVTAELHRLVNEGCKWEDQVFWSGSPSEEALKTRVFWMTFSMKFVTQSGNTYWKQFSFSRKAAPILEVIEITDPDTILNCKK